MPSGPETDSADDEVAHNTTLLEDLSARARGVLGAVYDACRQADPAREGLHVANIQDLLPDELEMAGAREEELDRILESAGALFQAVSPGVWSWREPSALLGAALAGSRLADQAYAYLLAHDVTGEGLHYVDSIIPGLCRWGVQIKGTDARARQATTRNAMLNDPRLVSKGRGKYAIRSSERTSDEGFAVGNFSCG